jgi:hypothetical protein
VVAEAVGADGAVGVEDHAVADGHALAEHDVGEEDAVAADADVLADDDAGVQAGVAADAGARADHDIRADGDVALKDRARRDNRRRVDAGRRVRDRRGEQLEGRDERQVRVVDEQRRHVGAEAELELLAGDHGAGSRDGVLAGELVGRQHGKLVSPASRRLLAPRKSRSPCEGQGTLRASAMIWRRGIRFYLWHGRTRACYVGRASRPPIKF